MFQSSEFPIFCPRRSKFSNTFSIPLALNVKEFKPRLWGLFPSRELQIKTKASIKQPLTGDYLQISNKSQPDLSKHRTQIIKFIHAPINHVLRWCLNGCEYQHCNLWLPNFYNLSYLWCWGGIVSKAAGRMNISDFVQQHILRYFLIQSYLQYL